ncbi:MAG: aminotransferase class I/II-fold pyridoxal phosphate-dependent enzyme [Flavisolibacter sp.]
MVMDIELAHRLKGIGEYYFSQKLKEIEGLNKEGEQIINLGIGSPDQSPHPDVIKELQTVAGRSDVHGYQNYKGVEILRKAIAAWYLKWYAVQLDPACEILPLMGSKEGIMHICMTYLNEGDEVLIPDPGYPTYSSAVQLAGGKVIIYALKEEKNWMIDFEELQNRDLTKVKLMWVNYPHMPTGQAPDKSLFQKLVAFGKKNNILICHDNPYSFILNDHPMSLLAQEGAMEVALELNSLSKSQNMAGWRVGTVCGAKERIEEILRFKSNMDSGMFLPVQMAAAKALSLDRQWYEQINKVYSARRIKGFELLDFLECSYSKNQVGMFIWAKIPRHYSDGYALSDELLYNARVFITPGGIFGAQGAQYIRLSLCSPIEKFELSIKRITKTVLP